MDASMKLEGVGVLGAGEAQVHVVTTSRDEDGSGPRSQVMTGAVRASSTPSKHDASEVRRLEEELRQARKLASVGMLVGGVAHDFNNLLAVIAVHAQMLERSLPPGDPSLLDLEQIRAAGRSAALLIRQLLSFARRQHDDTRLLELDQVIVDVKQLLLALVGRSVQMRFDLAGGSSLFLGDPGQMQQVLINLAVNARDAMPYGGELTIETGRVGGDEAAGRARDGAADNYVLLRVSDTGCGMDETTLARIFEPFYTTKGGARVLALASRSSPRLSRGSEGASR